MGDPFVFRMESVSSLCRASSRSPTSRDTRRRLRTSPAEALAIFKRFRYSFREFRSKPSAMFVGIEIAARRN